MLKEGYWLASSLFKGLLALSLRLNRDPWMLKTKLVDA
jgi:hypothetical protein